jgi:glycosyltransferase involved in cell wall biosynthesis
MKKLLYIAPHLSTGGLPQYLNKKIQLLINEFEIYLVEWVDVTGGRLVVQRDQLKDLIPANRFFTLSENKMELIDIINRVKPDIVHSEEIPEFYMDFNVATKLYSTDRDYIIVETSHDSSYDTTQKKFFPDKFMFVSNWQIDQYKDINIPKVLVEYPIEYKPRPNREEALKVLGLDPSKKHVLHVGLFTPRKNQKEFFEYAKSLPDYVFHSVGNQADNFKWYWEPLMNKKPDNVVWWDERKDVDNFYSSMDLFLFTSQGHDKDKETMPLVIREAISWNIPVLIYNLNVYQNYFDTFENVHYLDSSSFNNNCEIIKDILETDNKININEEAIIISTYPVQQSIIDSTKECIEALKKTGRKIILSSHVPIPIELQELVDYSVYDKQNILTKHTYYTTSWCDYGHFKVQTYLKGENNDEYHGPAVYTNYYNAASLAQNLGIKKLYFINYDYILNNAELINDISLVLNKKKAYVDEREYPEGMTSTTFFFGIKTDMFFKTHPLITSDKEYDSLMTQVKCHSNGYENIFYHSLIPFKNQIYMETKENWDKLINTNFTHNDFSRVEYSTVMPSNIENCFAIFYQNSNNIDSRTLIVSGEENGQETFTETINVTGKIFWYRLYPYNEESKINIKFKYYDSFNNKLIKEKEIFVDNNYILNQLPLNGLLEKR